MPRLSLAKLERHLLAAADRLRQEGLDAATYKDYIFGMLFLKRCSDVFEGEHEELIDDKVKSGMEVHDAEVRYGENPDFYDGFFVPERARWSHLQDKLNDGAVTYGSVLDTALGALSEANSELEHVLDHVQFLKTQSNKRLVSDDCCKDLVRIFSRYRLRNEDFQFSDLLGAAYEYLINNFAESAGKKGGDFYTPRDVIRLMARMLKPAPGMSIYDPTCGSGGMLIISREHVEQSGGDTSNLRLCGQVNDASAWSLCKLNMLLHGVPGADIKLQDTLLHPLHRDGADLERFDRVIANPPFSQNYSRANMEFPERFQWGWCKTTGKKGDLMFAQHMLAVCKTNGMVATVMPHGVLFRGSEEKKIRQKFLEQDMVEAVIALPQNLFYGASIPACILVMRPNLAGRAPNPNKPEARRDRVLFINADAEFHAGRAQNYLRPEDIEKIASTFDAFRDVPGYARVVSLEEIANEANDFNLNIRRYVDNAPPPDPHDVRAHLHGGIPMGEIRSRQDLFDALNFEPLDLFTLRRAPGTYADFASALAERGSLRPHIEANSGLQQRQQALRQALHAWWSEHARVLATLPTHRNLNAVRQDLLGSFSAALQTLPTFDRFKLAGILASWWTDTLPDLKTLLENGFPGVVDGWVDAIADALEDDDAKTTFDPYAHPLVRATMADYLERIAQTKRDIARLKREVEAFEQSNAPDDLEEEEQESWNHAKDLDRQIREIKGEHKEDLKELGKLEKAASKTRAGAETKAEYEAARASLAPVLAEIDQLQGTLAPYEQLKTDLAAARVLGRQLAGEFVQELKFRCSGMSDAEKQALVLDLFSQNIQAGLDAAFADKRQELVCFCENLWDKYHTTLEQLRGQRGELEVRLAGILRGVGYQ